MCKHFYPKNFYPKHFSLDLKLNRIIEMKLSRCVSDSKDAIATATVGQLFEQNLQQFSDFLNVCTLQSFYNFWRSGYTTPNVKTSNVSKDLNFKTPNVSKHPRFHLMVKAPNCSNFSNFSNCAILGFYCSGTLHVSV